MRKTHLIFCLLLVILAGCRFKPDDRPNFDADYMAPLLKSSVGFDDILQDTNFIQVNSDNSITLVYRDTVIDFKLTDIVEVPDTTLGFQVKLDSIQLTTDSIVQRLWLMDLARSGPSGTDVLIGSMHGSKPPFTIPGFKNISTDTVTIDAAQFFQQADLIGGYLDIEINNQLPVDLDSVIFILFNQGLYGNTDTTVNAFIDFIPKFTKQDTSIFMGGKTMESLMAGQLLNLNTSDLTTQYKIDTLNQFVEVKITLRDLGASKATAIFPEQNVIDSKNKASYYFGDGIELKKLGTRSGLIYVNAFNTIQNPIDFTFSLPSTTRNGVVVNFVSFLPESPNGQEISVKDTFDLSGYSIDLTLDGDSVNRFPQNITGKLNYTGKLVTMGLSDSIRVEYGLIDIVPEYVEGYLGVHNFSFQEAIAFDFFKAIKGGTLDLKDPKMSLTFINSLGMDGEMKIHEITGYNNRTGNNVTFNATPLQGIVDVVGPKLPNVGQVVSSKYVLDKSNSNLEQLLNLMPDSLYFDIEVDANKNGNPALKDNFATGDSRIASILDIEIPVHGMADMIVLETDMAFDLAGGSVKAPDKLKEGSLKLIAENYFPFEADVQIYFYNASNNLVDSLFTSAENSRLNAGVADMTGIVQAPTRSTLTSYYDSFRLERLKTSATSAKVRFTVSTKPSNQDVKIYSNYRIDFNLVGDFKYHIGN